jgi:hypothetical protein
MKPDQIPQCLFCKRDFTWSCLERAFHNPTLNVDKMDADPYRIGEGADFLINIKAILFDQIAKAEKQTNLGALGLLKMICQKEKEIHSFYSRVEKIMNSSGTLSALFPHYTLESNFTHALTEHSRLRPIKKSGCCTFERIDSSSSRLENVLEASYRSRIFVPVASVLEDCPPAQCDFILKRRLANLFSTARAGVALLYSITMSYQKLFKEILDHLSPLLFQQNQPESNNNLSKSNVDNNSARFHHQPLRFFDLKKELMPQLFLLFPISDFEDCTYLIELEHDSVLREFKSKHPFLVGTTADLSFFSPTFLLPSSLNHAADSDLNPDGFLRNRINDRQSAAAVVVDDYLNSTNEDLQFSISQRLFLRRTQLNSSLHKSEDVQSERQQQQESPFDLGIVMGRHCSIPDCGGLMSKKNFFSGVEFVSNPMHLWCCLNCGTFECSLCHEHLYPYEVGEDYQQAIANPKIHVCDLRDAQYEDSLIHNKTTNDHAVLPCPRCLTPISHGGGCDDMYCVVCGCKFGFKSGKMLGDNPQSFHNEHYKVFQECAQFAIPSSFQAYSQISRAYPTHSKFADALHLQQSILILFRKKRSFDARNEIGSSSNRPSQYLEIAKLFSNLRENFLTVVFPKQSEMDWSAWSLRISFSMGKISQEQMLTSMFRMRILRDELTIAARLILSFYESVFFPDRIQGNHSDSLIDSPDLIDFLQENRRILNYRLTRDLIHLRPLVMTNSYKLCALPISSEFFSCPIDQSNQQFNSRLMIQVNRTNPLADCSALSELYSSEYSNPAVFRKRDQWLFGFGMETPYLEMKSERVVHQLANEILPVVKSNHYIPVDPPFFSTNLGKRICRFYDRAMAYLSFFDV